MIKHLPGPHPTRSRAVIHEGRVHAVSFVTDKQPDMYRQTKSALAHIDATLREAGTDKSRILTAIVYIADMARKPEMNRAWDEWADRNSPPMRVPCGDARGRDAGRDRRQRRRVAEGGAMAAAHGCPSLARPFHFQVE